MSNDGNEAEDLAKLQGALVINMGTATPEGLANFSQALRAYNNHGGPVLFDPVGAGATRVRRNAVNTLMTAGSFSIIKGNESEISVIAGRTGEQQKGVDGCDSMTSRGIKVQMVRKLALQTRSIILMTGPTDILSDGKRRPSSGTGMPTLGKSPVVAAH